ncbi:formylglycine-generating enzyme family protein [Sandaracinus amylolyticus]|uniref:Sulfatase modifying factor 1 n=1 Tax=Sandaracinus amylolyticus TaxID=927083 RepID=A0A0F6YJZ5_9BACT|nr:SUMF1/EgtB/PvdO family nonheme iron enzyme [Sandaracinus amylolyticus]AKF08703.1 Sulfatase modifying factor 1 precursor [Sandaracinus amylolyticus]
MSGGSAAVRVGFVLVCVSLAACGPSRTAASVDRERPAMPRGPVPVGMVAIPGGHVRVGSDDALALEAPTFVAEVAPFYLDADEVSVARFTRFVDETHHVTNAERHGDASVFDLARGTWRLEPGATWRAPLGPSAPGASPDHPVTQVSWTDADAFCRWSGARLPTEVEWEHAARRASLDVRARDGAWRANVWQGSFPARNDVEDGFALHAPVGSFTRDALGLADLLGNVWEWTSSWLVPYPLRDDDAPFVPGPGSQRVMRGGSFLCAEDACHGHRVSARMGATPESALEHVGFRCARDEE